MFDSQYNDSSDNNHSITAMICEQAQLFGAAPQRDELDPRET